MGTGQLQEGLLAIGTHKGGCRACSVGAVAARRRTAAGPLVGALHAVAEPALEAQQHSRAVARAAAENAFVRSAES